MSRRRWLQAVFGLLYGPLAPVHELVGHVAFGAAWAGRRGLVLDQLSKDGGSDDLLLDVGCGDGRLLREALRRRIAVVGVDPSPRMVRRAQRSGVSVVRGCAQHLPLRAGSISTLCSTYPGPWIVEPETWREIGRVLAPGARVTVLLGGTVERGRLGRFRSFVGSLVYGSRRHDTSDASLPVLGNELVHGGWMQASDEWGTRYIWHGRRVESSL